MWISWYVLPHFVLLSHDFTPLSPCGWLFLLASMQGRWPKPSLSEQLITWPQLSIQECTCDSRWASESHTWTYEKIRLFSLKILVIVVLPGIKFANKKKSIAENEDYPGMKSETWWYTLYLWILTYLKSNLPPELSVV